MSAKIYPVLKSAKARTLIDNERYQKWYQESVEDPEKFWDKHGRADRLVQALYQGQEYVLQG